MIGNFSYVLLSDGYVVRLLLRRYIDAATASTIKLATKIKVNMIFLCLNKFDAHVTRENRGGGESTKMRRLTRSSSRRAAKAAVEASTQQLKKRRRTSTSVKVRTSRKKVIKPPKDWEKVWDTIEELRADRSAPVDAFGSEALPLRPPEVSKDVFEYQTLVALMLSSQTKDPVVGAAMRRLQKELKPNGLTMPSVKVASEDRVRELIYGVGFHNRKAEYIKRTTNILVEDYDCKVPNTFEELVKLPGVGPKMALIVLNAAFGKCVGVSIDTHLHRMLKQLEWVRKDSKNPEETRRQLESWLPRDRWPSMNLVWVGLGQEIRGESEKLIRKAITSSDPPSALRLLNRLFGPGKLNKVAKRAGIELP